MSKCDFCNIFFYEYKLNRKATQTDRSINKVNETNLIRRFVNKRTVKRWY